MSVATSGKLFPRISLRSCGLRRYDASARLPYGKAQALEAAVLQILIEPPALHLRQGRVELFARDGLIDEALAAPETGEIPRIVGLEFRRHREPPQREVFCQIGVHGLLGAVERAQIATHHLRFRVLRHPP